MNWETAYVTVPEALWSGNHIEYQISVHSTARGDEQLSSVYRRFREIHPVLEHLKALQPSLPPVPEKRYFGSTRSTFVEERRKAIERFLTAVVARPAVAEDVSFLALIGFTLAKANKALKNAALDDDIEGDGGATQTSWVSSSNYVSTMESSTVMAQSFLRSTDFALQRALPDVAFRRTGVSRAVIVNPTGEKRLLSCYRANTALGVDLSTEKGIRRFRSALERCRCRYVRTPISVAVDSGWVLCVDTIFSKGSFRDKAFDASWDDDAASKFRGKGSPFSVGEIARVARAALLTVRLFHYHNIPCGFLHLGNCYEDRGEICFSGVETTLLGMSRYPVALPRLVDGAGEVPVSSAPHPDVMAVGLMALEMALGGPLAEGKEEALLGTADITSPGDATFERGADDTLQAKALASLPACVPEEVAGFVRRVWATTNTPSSVEALLRDSFLKHAKVVARPSTGTTQGVEGQLAALKTSEWRLFVQVADKWELQKERVAARRVRVEEGKDHLRELKHRALSSPSADVVSPPRRGRRAASSTGTVTPHARQASSASMEVSPMAVRTAPHVGVPPPPPPPT